MPVDGVHVEIDIETYRDKLRGSVHGQLFGLAWGFARGIEFRYRRRLVPDSDFPDSSREVDMNIALVAPAGDDFYNEMPGLLAMNGFGPQVTWKQMESFYRDTNFSVWHSDEAMRRNLKAGVPAPECGHYTRLIDAAPYGHADDLDAQMQADFCGTTNPGNPNAAIAQAWKFGHLMNYGDGAIGAAVIASMNAEAFVAEDVEAIARAGLAAAPAGSQYRALLVDVLAWHSKWPDDWKQTWRALDERWGGVDRCPRGNGVGRGADHAFNIDAKIHGGFIFMGLLYGNGDFLDSLAITIRCGQDTDTSAQNLGSILGAYLGDEGLPSVVHASEPKTGAKVEGTSWTLPEVMQVQETAARKSLRLQGGRVVGDGPREVWQVPRRPILPPLLEQWPSEKNSAPELSAKLVRVEGMRVEVSASATDAEGVLDYQWHFGDLSHANGASVQHEYRVAGEFEIVCYVTDRTGHTSYERIPVVIQASSE